MKKLLIFVLVCNCLGFKTSSCQKVDTRDAVSLFITNPKKNGATVNCLLDKGLIDGNFYSYKRLVTQYKNNNPFYKETLKNLYKQLVTYTQENADHEKKLNDKALKNIAELGSEFDKIGFHINKKIQIIINREDKSKLQEELKLLASDHELVPFLKKFIDEILSEEKESAQKKESQQGNMFDAMYKFAKQFQHDEEPDDDDWSDY